MISKRDTVSSDDVATLAAPNGGREGGASTSRSSKILAFVGIFLLWWILTTLVYHHTQSNFLRAETGWFLFLSHSTPAVQHDSEKALLTGSFHGHYAPLGLLAEFESAKLVGTHASFWKWRQITLLALLGTMTFLFVRNSGYAFQLSQLRANFAAVGLTAILIFQGQMREFVAEPILMLQLCWLLFTVVSLLGLVQMARHPAKAVWPWVAAGAAYASLQFLGLGMATVAGTAAALAGLWFATRRRAPSDASKLTVPLLSIIALTALHGICVVKLARPETIVPSASWEPTQFLMASLVYIPNFAWATLRGLFSTGLPALSTWLSVQYWPYGLAILLGFGFLVTFAFSRFRKEPTVRNRTRFILHTFASVSFLALIALTSAREWHEPSPHGFADYLTGSRYLIPGSFSLAGLIGELFFVFPSAPIFAGAILNVGLAVCAIFGNLHYAKNIYPKVFPRSMISHAHAWQAVVAMAGECQRANLPIPNVPLGALTQEFIDWDLKLFAPLLRADLKAAPGTSFQFVEWTDLMNALPNEYNRDVPSLSEVRKRLKL